MQQYSSVPENKSQLNKESVLAMDFQQVQAQLWLERILNQLQTRLCDCLTVTSDSGSAEEILQIFVNELDQALPKSWFAIATPLVESDGANPDLQLNASESGSSADNHSICVVSFHPQSKERIPELSMKATGKSLRLQVGTIIDINDLLELQNSELVMALPMSWVRDEQQPAWLLW